MVLHTASSIAKMMGVSRFSVDYIIRRFDIKEIGRAGATRLYDADGARQIIEGLGKLPRGVRRMVANAV